MPNGKTKAARNGADGNRATSVRFDAERLVVRLTDGRELSAPLRHYPTLRRATAAERDDWQPLNGGAAIRWPRLDLDLSTAALVNGLPEAVPAPPATSRRKRTA